MDDQHLTRRLLNYFATVGMPHDHLFTLRDINHQVMMNVYAPEERALLGVALAKLVVDGVLRPETATSYRLTAEGLRRVRSLDAGVSSV